MTPQDKAKELFYKFYDNKSTDLLETYLKVDLAKMSALIAVDEILEELSEILIVTASSYVIKHIDYYQKVKTEIEKL